MNEDEILDEMFGLDKIPKLKEPRKIVHKQIGLKATVEQDKRQVQICEIEKYQWYGIELGKALSLSENRRYIQRIYHDAQSKGEKAFVIRPIKTYNDQKTAKTFEDPMVKPVNKSHELHRWFIPWKHNVQVPGFITYVPKAYEWKGKWYRIIDIDYDPNPDHDELHNHGDIGEFGLLNKKLCDANMVARRLGQDDARRYCKEIQRIGGLIQKNIGKTNLSSSIYYSGGGFRTIAKADTYKELKELVNIWMDEGLVCRSSIVGYHPQKLFSVSTLSPHFGTEIAVESPYLKYSSPGLFYIKYTTELTDLLYEYYRTFIKREYSCIDEDTMFQEMVKKQITLEKKIIECLKNLS